MIIFGFSDIEKSKSDNNFQNMKEFSERKIKSMRLFYEGYVDDKIWQQHTFKLPYGRKYYKR